MHQKIKTYLLGFLLLINLDATAQEFYANNNSEIKALAARQEITRISFDSPVTEVHAISEEIEYVINGKDIYLRMLLEEKPVNFFVKCEDDNTYKLLLVTQDGPADQIFIHKKSSGYKTAAKTEYFGDVSAEDKTRISRIIEIALNPTKHIGYSIEQKNSSLLTELKNIKLKLESLISGNKLIAEKIRLTNKSDRPIALNLKDFAESKYLAVYLNKSELLPKEEVILIRIIEN